MFCKAGVIELPCLTDLYLGMRKNSSNVETSGAFNVHKETIGSLYKSLQLVLSSFVTL